MIEAFYFFKKNCFLIGVYAVTQTVHNVSILPQTSHLYCFM